MDSFRILFQHYMKLAWQRRWVGVATAWVICVIGWAGIYTLPNQYESSARMYVDADAILTPLLRGLAADTTPVSQLDVLQRTLLSGPNLEKLIGKTDLDLSVVGPGDRENLVRGLSTAIKIVPQTRNLFTITYRNPNPKLAYDVVQTLLTIFIESATGGSRLDMENARRFLEHQISSYEQQLRSAERRRAEFRIKYVDILPPELGGGVANVVEMARGSARALLGQLQDATLRRDSLKSELASTNPLLVVEKGVQYPGFPGGNVGPPSRLEMAIQELAELKLKYTDAHPDVISTKKRIAELRATGGGASSAATGGAKDNSRSLPNPVYEQIKIRLLEADANVSSLQRQADEAVTNRDKLEKIQREQPGLLAESQNLDRDYNVIRKNYEELLSRLQSANIAQAADTQADKVKLQIIDPPKASRIPVAPNRMLLVAAVLLIGLATGIAVPILLGQFDNSFSTVDSLRSLGFPVLGGISMLNNVTRQQRVMATLRFSAAVLLLVAVFGGILAQIIRTSVSI